ncbi:helix-turn-helix domain-containing protein [Ammoniphilus sp. YIM 78166]|uniref:helix-turn-helix domain-containing protein n=1 Tax=Ammoniphilus sp. YIM 78166 TaxID=1644106 RepID=UPI0010704282|nr:helix-turn-helix transcriptional regulator [Ammoniphilus sp. YIM 78166]
MGQVSSPTFLYDRLRESRTELNLSREYVSNLMSFSLSELVDIESGKLIPEEHQVAKMAEIYGCPLKYFYADTEEKTSSFVLTRRANELSDFDKQQVEDFLAFQKLFSNEMER